MSRISKVAGVEGNLKARASAESASGFWRDMINNINGLVDSIAVPVLEVGKVLKNISRGNLDETFQIPVSGDFKVMAETPHHTYQVLTKRPGRARNLASELEWPENLWLGTSVEDARVLKRLDYLRATPARLKMLFCEPLLGPLGDLNLDGIGWVSILDYGKVERLLGLPEGVQLIAYLCIGFPREFRARPMLEEVGWRSRMPIQGLIYQDGWGQPCEWLPRESGAPDEDEQP